MNAANLRAAKRARKSGTFAGTRKLCLLLATTSLSAFCAAPAFAQSVPDVPPPSRFQTDENGVDVARGTYTGFATDISIGPDGPGGLAFVRRFGSGANASNYELALYNSGSSWTASAGLESYEFTLSGTTYVSSDGKGATLVKSGSSHILTTADGAKISYDFVTKAITDSPNRQARGTSITWPTGEKVTLTYATATYCIDPQDICGVGMWRTEVRLQSASSSLGYQLHFNYATDEIVFPSEAEAWRLRTSIQAINTTVDPCDPAAPTCSTTQAWPTASYSGSYVTDPQGRVTRYTRATGKFAIKRASSSVDNVTYNLNASNRVTSVVRDGLTWAYSYSVSGNVATMAVTDPLNHVRTFVSDLTVGLPTSVKDELNRTTSYQYDSSGRLTRATAPEGNYVQYAYDSRGNVTTTTAVAKVGSGLANIVSSAAYPASCANAITCNKPTSTTDPRGNVTDYSYDGTHGGLLTVTAPAPTAGAVRPQARLTYSSLTTPGGPSVYRLTATSACQTQASCAGTADEVKTTIAYNHANRLPTGVSSGAGNGSLTATRVAAYDNIGNVLTVDGPLAGTADTTKFRYNAVRELIGTVSPDPDGAGPLKHRASRTTYNLDGQATRVETGTASGQADADLDAMSVLESATTDYDSSARPVVQKLIGSDGATYALTQLGYDGEGRLECTAQRMNPAAFASLPASACSLGTQGSFGPDRISKAIYDAADQVTKVQVAVGTADQTDEVSTVYTGNGKVYHMTDGEGNTTGFGYDGFDRLNATAFPLPAKGSLFWNTGDQENLTYDAAGNVVSKHLRNGQVIGFTFDNLNRVTLKNMPGAEPDVSYGYDNLGRLTSANQTGHALSFGYDALGRNIAQTGPLGTVSSAYNLAGQRVRLIHADGKAVNYGYNLLGEMNYVYEDPAGSNDHLITRYWYDDLGRRQTVVRGADLGGTSTTSYYDAASRLSTLANDPPGTANDFPIGLGYNPASQIVSRTMANTAYAWTGHGSGTTATIPNGLNQIAASGGVTFSHDARGNLTSDGATTFAYDSENKLVSASGAKNATLAYDPLGRLYQITSGGGSTRFLYDGLELIGEYNGAGAFMRRHVHGPGVDEPVASYEGSSLGLARRKYQHADERGSIISLFNADGSLNAINRYDEYGKPQGTLAGRFGFTGQMWLPEVGLYYYKARMYDPEDGRFPQFDPIGYAGGMNGYNGMRGDPVNFTDPFGLRECYGTATWKDGRVIRIRIYCEVYTGNVAALFNGSGDGPGSGGRGGGAGRKRPAPPDQQPTDGEDEPKQDCNALGKAIAEGAYDFGTKLTDYSSSVIAAGLLAKSPQGIAVGEIAALAGTGLQALGAAGRLLATGNVTRARYDAVGVAFSFFQSQTKAASLALGLTAGKAVELRSQLTPGQDCKK